MMANPMAGNRHKILGWRLIYGYYKTNEVYKL